MIRGYQRVASGCRELGPLDERWLPFSSPSWLQLIVNWYSSFESEQLSKTGAPQQAVAPSSRLLRRRSKSSSKSEGDLDCVASSDWFESDSSSPGAARVEVALKTDVLSICLGRSRQQLIEVVDKLINVAALSWCRGLRLPRLG
jgi:hypothetical protein